PDIDPIQWDDAIIAVEKARGLPSIDPKRVAVVGGSHGGLTFSRVASRVDATCGVLCAPAILDLCEISKAVANGGKVPGSVMNLVRGLEAKSGATVDEIEKDPDRYGYSSALTEAAKVRFPLLIINGRNDTACPCSVAEIYVQKLRAAGKEVDTYFPDNGPHGFYFGSPQEIPETAVAAQRMVEFITKQFAKVAEGSKVP
ncbi:MAG: prolyl oligopeptidase family serine peptidase, partial [Candidatus Sumerlaeota bacterium]|nr:prolyl oligopeptidase family serine peptidase [Candidatus Sumerlaeota bacterium]